MTLIYAYTSISGIHMYSDTQIVHEVRPDTLALNSDWTDTIKQVPGELKLLLIGRKHVVGYAGQGQRAIEALRSVQPEANTNELLSALYKCHQHSQRKTDFLAASAVEPSKIYRISHGEVLTCSNHSWIGDPCAANRLLEQVRIAKASICSEMEMESRISFAFSQLLSNRNQSSSRTTPSIGGICISVSQKDSAFNYSSGHEVYIGHLVQTISSEPTRLRFGSIQDGRWSCSVHVPVTNDVAAVGLWFDGISLGYVLAPLLWDNPRELRSRNRSEFLSAASQAVGCQIH